MASRMFLKQVHLFRATHACIESVIRSEDSEVVLLAQIVTLPAWKLRAKIRVRDFTNKDKNSHNISMK